MGFLLNEHGDPKSWAGCMLCGLAAMGEDELEENKDKRKQAEREARWKAAKTPIPVVAESSSSTAGKPLPAEPVPVKAAEDPDEISPVVVTQQPKPLPPMPSMASSILAPQAVRKVYKAYTPPPADAAEEPIAKTATPPAAGLRSTPPAQMYKAYTTPRSSTPPQPQTYQVYTPSPASRDSPKKAESPKPKKITGPVCDGTDHKEDKCPCLAAAGISAEPSKAMSQFSSDDYAALGHHPQDSLRKWLKREGSSNDVKRER